MTGSSIVESERLQALRRTNLLDTDSEPEFDELVQIAAAICAAPISLVSLVDQDRQWFKAVVGLDVRETSRQASFCDHAMRQSTVMVIEDASTDPRFRDNPLVIGDLGIRFYAGIRVQSPEGQPLGSLCVLDQQPRTLTAEQQAALNVLGRQVNARIELQMQRMALKHALEDAQAARGKLAASEQRFKAFMDSGPFLSVLRNERGELVYYNRPFAERFGVEGVDSIGYSNHDRLPPEPAARTTANDDVVRATRQPQVFLEESPNSDGTISKWRTYKFACLDADGSSLHGAIAMDVTEELARETALQQSRAELQQANLMLENLATTDPLTGLANRRLFDERLHLEFKRSRRNKLPLSLLMLDLDNFKSRNDSFGHGDGDTVLRTFAQILRRTTRETDLVARYGGEEFIVLLPGANEQAALEFAGRILDAVRSEPWPHRPVTVSIGAYGMTDATPNYRRLVTLADEALYRAKNDGKDRVVAYGAFFQQLLLQLKP